MIIYSQTDDNVTSVDVWQKLISGSTYEIVVPPNVVCELETGSTVVTPVVPDTVDCCVVSTIGLIVVMTVGSGVVVEERGEEESGIEEDIFIYNNFDYFYFVVVKNRMGYKEEVQFDDRCHEANKVKNKCGDRIPLIIERANGTKCALLTKRKFLVPEDLNARQLLCVIRKQLKLQHDIALYIYVGNTLPKMSDTMGMIYNQHKDEDGFLYIKYSTESTFG